jgi:heterodisulfide reductase subunit C
MQYADKKGLIEYDAGFPAEVKAASGAIIDRCYQCFTCSLGCPSAFAMDYLPNQIVRMVQLGLKRQTLTSSTIWVCANCESCVTRCPNQVDILSLMDALREMALREGTVKEIAVAAFHQAFLGNIRRWGRQHELSLMLKLKLKTRDLFSDLDLGIRMLRKGKLKMLPQGLKEAREMKAIFQRTEKRPTGGEGA